MFNIMIPNEMSLYTFYNGNVFVIGSMSGNRMDNAKEALFLFLKSLPADCYFNIVSFGSRYSSLFKYVLPNVIFCLNK